MRGTEAIAQILKQEGTEYLFSYPNHPLIDECAKLGIRPIIARDRFAAARAGASAKSGGEHEKKMQGRGQKRRRAMRSAGERSARIVNRNSDIEKGKA